MSGQSMGVQLNNCHHLVLVSAALNCLAVDLRFSFRVRLFSPVAWMQKSLFSWDTIVYKLLVTIVEKTSFVYMRKSRTL